MTAPFKQLPFRDLPDTPRLPHPYFETPAHTLQLDSVPFGPHDVHYRTCGEGPPLLLVHGLMTAGYSWRYVLDALGAHYTLYVPDLPGSGRTDKPDRSYHPDALATWIGELIDALGITGCRVIGNSLGGYLCMRLALQRPDAMSHLVNLHSPGVPLFRLRLLKGALNWIPGSESILRRLVHYDPELWVHKNVHYYDESLKSREEAREYAEPLRTVEGVHAFYRILKETMDPVAMKRFHEQLQSLDTFPVSLLLMYARTDPVVPPWVGEAMGKALPDADFVWLDEASHFAHVDHPEAFLPPVLDFLG